MEQTRTHVWISDDYEQSLKNELKNVKKEKREKKIKKQLKKVKLIGKAFVVGVKGNAIEPTTLGFSTIIGLTQGLKYNGSIKRGVLSGLATLAAFSVVGGIATVGKYISEINKISREDE